MALMDLLQWTTKDQEDATALLLKTSSHIIQLTSHVIVCQREWERDSKEMFFSIQLPPTQMDLSGGLVFLLLLQTGTPCVHLHTK